MPSALMEAWSFRRRSAGGGAGETDAELIQRVGGRDPLAFEELYRRFARPVLGLALRLLGDHGRAEDATQETFSSV